MDVGEATPPPTNPMNPSMDGVMGAPVVGAEHGRIMGPNSMPLSSNGLMTAGPMSGGGGGMTSMPPLPSNGYGNSNGGIPNMMMMSNLPHPPNLINTAPTPNAYTDQPLKPNMSPTPRTSSPTIPPSAPMIPNMSTMSGMTLNGQPSQQYLGDGGDGRGYLDAPGGSGSGGGERLKVPPPSPANGRF